MAPDQPIPRGKWDWVSPRCAFVWIALLFGLPLALITAPFQAPDEPQHLLRAYQISEGGLLPTRRGAAGGGNLPVSLIEAPRPFAHLRFHRGQKTSLREIRAALGIPLDARRREFIPFVTAIYSPIAYVAQAMGIALGRLLKLPPLGLMYLARIANLLAWVLLGYVAMRIAPACHRALLLLLLMPMSLFQAASMSGDATTNGLAVLFTAAVFRLALGTDRPPIRPAQWTGLTVLSAAMTLTKFAYLPLAGLVLLIPMSRFPSRSRYAVGLVVFFAVNVLGILAWMPQTRGLDAVVRDRADVSAPGQFHYLIDHPAALVTVTARTVAIDGWSMARSFVGWLGSMDARMSALFVIAYLLALFAACWTDALARPPLPLGHWIAITLLALGLSIGAVGLLNYIYWTPIGATHVEGMQGRYFIPLAPAIVFLVWGLAAKLPGAPWNRLSERNLSAIASGITVFGGGYAVMLLIFRYYY